MRRAIGVVVIAAAAVAGAIGALWLVFAIVGTEWDYCVSGRNCIPGEVAGGAIVTLAAVAGWIGVRLAARS